MTSGVARRRESRIAFGFLSPWLIGFAVFTAGPMVVSAALSFTEYDVISSARFVGVHNYVALVEDPRVGLALANTLWFTLLSVPAHLIVAFSIALLLNRAGRAAGLFRTLVFLPKMTPAVAIGVLFLLLFNGGQGLVNRVLAAVGIAGPNWTTDPAWVKPGLVIMSLWTIGSAVIILLAALQAVPTELYEAARIDGAGPVRQTVSITLPLVSPTLFFLAVVTTIAGFQTFTEAYTAFFGAGNSTYSNDAALFYVIYLFRQAFEYLHLGFASAMAWVLFAIIVVVTIVQFRVARRLVHYEVTP